MNCVLVSFLAASVGIVTPSPAPGGRIEGAVRNRDGTGVPGINMDGDYMRDYAQDPAAFFKKDYERVYGDLIRQAIQQYGP